MKFLTFMLITLSGGDQIGLRYPSMEDCAKGLQKIGYAEEQLQVEVSVARCVETTAPTTSIRPHRRGQP